MFRSPVSQSITLFLSLAISGLASPSAASDRVLELNELIRSYQTEMKLYRELPEGQRGVSPWTTYPAKFLQFAEAGSDESSLKACEFITLNFYIAIERWAAISLAVEQHRNKPGFGEFLGQVVFMHDLDEEVDPYFTMLAESEDAEIKALALYHQAKLMLDRSRWLLEDPTRYDGILDREYIAMLRAEETPTRIKELLKQTIALNPCSNYFGKSLTETAERLLFELESLTIGSTFPEISWTDSQGKPFSISDYRGRVVVVVFWAGWRSACIETLPSKVVLVRQLADKPFVMLGVNGDVEIKDLQKLELKHGVNFRSWHDGRGGPIASQLNVDGWPVVFVIDGDGKIRYNSKLMAEDVTVESVVGELLSDIASEGTQSTEGAR